MRSIKKWVIIAAGSFGLFIAVQPGRSVAQTNSTNKADSAPASEQKKEALKKKNSKSKEAAPRKSFTPTTKVPVGMPIDFPADI